MANYSTLKAAVEAVVKTNGEQAITGANMQTVLLSIINSIGGGGYIFEGVATPSTNSGTPDQNVFYIGGAGTYANFGTSVTVLPTNIAVFKYNGTWTCEQVTVENGGVFDISAFKAVGGTLATFADLSAALGTNGANVPEGVRKGGMSIKFVCSSDNKYVQYRFLLSTFNDYQFANPANWQGIDEEIELGSINLAESGSIADKLSHELDRNSKPYALSSAGTFAGSSHNHACIPVSAEDVYYLISETAGVRYAFATSDTYTDGGAIPFVSGTELMTTGSANTYTKVTIPSGCNYLLFNSKLDGSGIFDTKCLKVAKVSEIVDSMTANAPYAGGSKLSNAGSVFAEKLINEIDVFGSIKNEDYKIEELGINSSGKWESGYHITIPVKGRSKFTIIKTTSAHVLGFLKTYPIGITDGDDVNFSDIQSSRIVVSDSEAEINVPSDAICLCISTTTQDKATLFPYLIFDRKKIADNVSDALSSEVRYSDINLKPASGTINSLVIGSNLTWQSTSGRNSVLWTIDPVSIRKIKVYNFRTGNCFLHFLRDVTPVAGEMASFALNSTRYTIAAGVERVFDVPFDCKYICTYNTLDNEDNFPAIYLQRKTNDSVDDLRSSLYGEKHIDFADYSQYMKDHWIINSSGKWYNGGRSYCIPVKANSTIKISQPYIGVGAYAFLKCAQPWGGENADFVSGYSRQTITANTSIIITSPNVDCYLYLTDLVSDGSTDSRLPDLTISKQIPSLSEMQNQISALTPDEYSLNEIGVGKDNQIGIWTYYPKAIHTKTYRNKLIWGWTDNTGRTGVAEYNLDDKVLKKTTLKKIDEVDDHNNPFVFELPDGRIAAGYHGMHMGNGPSHDVYVPDDAHNTLHIRISKSKELVEEFDNVINVKGNEIINYGQCFYLYNKYYIFFRYAPNSNGNGWGYVESTDFVTWSAPKKIFTADRKLYMYFSPVSDNANILRFCMLKHPDYLSDIKMGFFDASTGNIMNSDQSHTILGNISQDTFTFDSFDTIVERLDNKRIRLFDVAVSPMNTSIIACADYPKSGEGQNQTIYNIARNGVREFIVNGGKDRTPNYPLGMAIINSDNVVVCYGVGDDGGTDKVGIFNYSNSTWSLVKTVYSEVRDPNNTGVEIRQESPMVSTDGKFIIWFRGYYGGADWGDFETNAKIYDIENDEVI